MALGAEEHPDGCYWRERTEIEVLRNVRGDRKVVEGVLRLLLQWANSSSVSTGQVGEKTLIAQD
jgi:hypothetical protein